MLTCTSTHDHRWLALRDEAAATRADLRRCLLTKRVAFQAFKRWYWESFEGDVQVGVLCV